MGCVTSLCSGKENDVQKYVNLVTNTPGPIVLDQISTSDSDSAPLFPAINTDTDSVQDGESLTDEELRLYAEKLSKKND